MKLLRSLERWFMRNVDIRITFAALCIAILLLVFSFSPSLFSSKSAPTPLGEHFNLWEESERHLDIHFESPERGHIMGDSVHGSDSVISKRSHMHSHARSNRTTIALGLAITARDQEFLTLDNVPYRTPLLKTLIPTFCKTASEGFDYHFYAAFDMNDPFLSREEFLRAIYQRFQELVDKLCPSKSRVFLHFVQCKHNRSPSWAQNDAMMEAYLDGMDFYYRLNDDTQMLSPGWTESFIEALNGFKPPLVGVVGPLHRGGNEDILTYDFVHRTHIDIFGYYYPRLFTDWWADNWMTKVYGDEHTLKSPTVRVMHTLEAGTRYKIQYDISSLVAYQIAEDKATLSRYLKSRNSPAEPGDQYNKVISMSLWGSTPRYTFGALRNAQLVPVFFPGWKLRVYVEQPMSSGKTQHQPVPERILSKLEQLGAELLYVNAIQSHIPPMMWRFLVADDMSVDYFIVRDADARLSDRDALAVKDWMENGAPFHCVRDHPSHASYALLGGLWGAQPRKLREVMSIPWQDLMMGYRQDYIMDMTFLANAVWPKVQRHAYCHDSVSCQDWPAAHPFPLKRIKGDHLGQVFDAFGNPRDDDVKILMQRPVVEACFTNKYTLSVPFFNSSQHFMGLMFEGGDSLNDVTLPQEIVPYQTSGSNISAALETSPVHRDPVIWSVDYHSSPIRDIKSLLVPLGFKFLDQSFSSKCLFSRNCASNLRVLNKKNGMQYDPSLADKFFAEYVNDPEMNLVTHFLCTYPVALCELYMQFDKPIILYVTHRYEMGRYLKADWENWNQHFIKISQDPENAILANNQFDAAYVEYFTGVRPKVILSHCKYVNAHYRPIKASVLLAPTPNPTFEDFLFTEIDQAKRRNSSQSAEIHKLHDVYPEYTFENISSHRAVIHIPYQVATMTFCEHYYMNIPIFVPTIELLIDWHMEFSLLASVTFNSVRSLSGQPGDSSPLPGHIKMPDPNKIGDRASLNAWLRLADFYTWRHIILFNSIDDLLEKLSSMDLKSISKNMRVENHSQGLRALDEWQRVFRGV